MVRARLRVPAGIAVAKRAPGAEVDLVDINPAALRAARVNASLAGVEGVAPRRSDLLRDVEGRFDLIVSNPPFMVDASARAYRHGGGVLGAGLSLAVNALKLSDFGETESLRGDPFKILMKLKESAPVELRAKLEYLAHRTHCVVSSHRLMVFSYERSETKTSARTLVLVPLYDDRELDEAATIGMLAPFVEEARKAA